MPELVSFSDVKNRVLSRANEEVDGTSDWDADAGTAVVAAHRRLVGFYPWMALEKYPPGVVLVPAAVTDLLITTTAGQTSATFGGPAASYATSRKDWKIIPTGKDYPIRVTAHTAAATALTVDAAPETLAAVACTVYQDEVDLPSDFMFFLNCAWTNGGEPIRVRGDEQTRVDYPDQAGTSWPPVQAVRIGKTKLRFSSYPDARKRVEIPYTFDPGDPSGTGTMSIDDHLRVVLVELARPEVLRHKKAEAEAQRIELLAQGMLARAADRDRQLRRSLLGQLSREQPAAGIWS